MLYRKRKKAMINKDELLGSGVVFDEQNHTYTLGDRQLKGITGLIKALKFPDKYAGIPQSILAHAAEEGKNIHSSCELADKLGIVENDEAQAYLDFKAKAKCYTIANEFTVTDGQNWASNIDCVWAKDKNDDIYLADIKTTNSLDEEYLSWQLSIYAHLFEGQTGRKVKGLYGILLFKEGKSNDYGERRLVKITRKKESEVKEILTHVDYENEALPVPAKVEENMLDISRDLQMEVAILIREIKELTERKKELETGLKQLMEENGCKSFKSDILTISYVAESETIKFDEKRFAAERPKLYKQYLTAKSVKSSSIRITSKQNGR